MQTKFIRQLTGVRFVAAVWVMLFHFRLDLEALGLGRFGLQEFFSAGFLGVDLFFALSGFILTYTYLNRLGPRFRMSNAGHFLWLRLSRIYPVHFLMLNLVVLAVITKDSLLSQGSPSRDWITMSGYVKNLFLVQAWGPAASPGWNFVAWSLSMEWLAYLLFPFLALLLWRFHRSLPLWGLLALWAIPMAALAAYALRGTGPWENIVRIATEFSAGSITYLIVTRVASMPGRASGRMVKTADACSLIIPILIVVAAAIIGRAVAGTANASQIDIMTEGDLGNRGFYILVPLLVIWLGALALSDRGVMVKVLSAKTLVLGGSISFALYMTHSFCFGIWRVGMQRAGIDGGVVGFLAFLTLITSCLVVAWLVWRFFEEPAREWMRKLVGDPPVPVDEVQPTTGV